MDLYVVHHADAGTPDPRQWPDDSQRPLTKSGERDFRRLARSLRHLNIPVARVWSSSLARAWQTALALSEEAHWPQPTPSTALSEGRSLSDVIAELQGWQDRSALAVVGHEPQMTSIVSWLLTGKEDQVIAALEHGAVAKLQVDRQLGAGTSQLQWLVLPQLVPSSP